MEEHKKVYLDYAAATPMKEEVAKAMQPYFTKNFANPSSIHSQGEEAKETVDNARQRIAKILNCKETEIIFTASGSESINLAIQGIARAKVKGHIITSSAEHAATLRCCEWLEANGFAVTYIDPNKDGIISAKQVEDEIREDTILITLLYANNEVGSISPVQEIAKIAKKYTVPFHIDACQAANYLSLDTKELGADLMTINSSKIYGPKGVALLFIKENTNIKPLIFGGKQENNIRSGTLNVPGIVGFAKALGLVNTSNSLESERLTVLRDEFIEKVLTDFDDVYLNGSKENRLPNNVNISFLGIDSQTLVMTLSSQGVYVSNGSACSSGEIKASHVLVVMGLDEFRAKSSIRFSFGSDTKKEDLDYTFNVLKRTIKALREVAKLN